MDDDTELYGELCDLFDQAITMGREGEHDPAAFDAEPDTDPDRQRMTSPQARRFANAATELLGRD